LTKDGKSTAPLAQGGTVAASFCCVSDVLRQLTLPDVSHPKKADYLAMLLRPPIKLNKDIEENLYAGGKRMERIDLFFLLKK